MLTPNPQRPVQYGDVNQVILCRYKFLMETSNVMLSASGKMRTIVRSFEVRPLDSRSLLNLFLFLFLFLFLWANEKVFVCTLSLVIFVRSQILIHEMN